MSDTIWVKKNIPVSYQINGNRYHPEENIRVSLYNKEELQKRNIFIGDNVIFGDDCFVANNASIHHFTKLGNECDINFGAKIYSDVTIGDRSVICSNSIIESDSVIGTDVLIDSDSRIEYSVTIGSSTRIANSCIIGNYSSIGSQVSIKPYTNIGFKATIKDNTEVKSIYINGSKHNVLYWGEDCIQIGCKQATINDWILNYKSIGEEYSYTIEQIQEYKNYINMISHIHF